MLHFHRVDSLRLFANEFCSWEFQFYLHRTAASSSHSQSARFFTELSYVTNRKKFQSTLIFHQTPAYNWKAEAFFRDDDKQFVQKDFEQRIIQHSIRAEMVQAWSGYERRGHSTRCCWWTTQEPAAVVVGSRTKKIENGKSLRKNTSFHCSSLVRNSRKQCSRRRMDD